MFQVFLKKTFQLLSQYAADPDDPKEWRLKKTIRVFADESQYIGTLYPARRGPDRAQFDNQLN